MYKKTGFPERNDFVICTVKNVATHSVTFDLDEFQGIEGTVTSSEMSRKWARNIRIFLKPNRKMVCKVLRVETQSKHIYLSIRRVGTSQTQTKQKEWGNEKRADDLLHALSKLEEVTLGGDVCWTL